MFVKDKGRRSRNRLNKLLDGNEVWHLKGEGETRRNRRKILRLQSRFGEVSARFMGSSGMDCLLEESLCIWQKCPYSSTLLCSVFGWEQSRDSMTSNEAYLCWNSFGADLKFKFNWMSWIFIYYICQTYHSGKVEVIRGHNSMVTYSLRLF